MGILICNLYNGIFNRFIQKIITNQYDGKKGGSSGSFCPDTRSDFFLGSVDIGGPFHRPGPDTRSILVRFVGPDNEGIVMKSRGHAAYQGSAQCDAQKFFHGERLLEQ